MAMTTSVLLFSQYITYWMAYCDSMCLFHHNYYINSDVRHLFILNVHFPLYWWSQLLSFLTPYHLLFPWMTVSAYNFLLPIFLSFVSTLDSITSFLDSTFSTFPTSSLVEGGPICRVSMCFHPMITSRNFINSDPYKDFVNKSAIMCSVMQHEIDILLLSTRSFTKK